MDIGNNIMKLRKKKNLSQEELAERVGVARQTISKWELGETSPDLKQAKALSKIFNVSLDELSGNSIKDVLIEKTSNAERLAGIILKLLKILVVLIILAPILMIILKIVFKNIHNISSGRLMNSSIECTIHDETYHYEFLYYENTGEIKEAGGDAYLSNIIDIDKYGDAYKALDVINFNIKNYGGTCKRSEPTPIEDNKKQD